MIDFNSRSALSDRINFLIDGAIPSDNQKREYLGASVVGHHCERFCQYHLLAARGEVERPIPAPRILRIFDRGNLYEERSKQWLKQAGFLFGRTEKGKQFSDFNGQFKGHVDGILTGWKRRDLCPITLPALWENKCLGNKGWKKVSEEKLKNYSSTYYVQVQIYMHYLGLERCLFTAVNADTMEIYHELVPYDQAEASLSLARVQAVISASDAGQMVPRCTQDKNYYICKMCDFRGGCWA